MTNALSYSSSVSFEGMLRRVLDPLAEEARRRGVAPHKPICLFFSVYMAVKAVHGGQHDGIAACLFAL